MKDFFNDNVNKYIKPIERNRYSVVKVLYNNESLKKSRGKFFIMTKVEKHMNWKIKNSSGLIIEKKHEDGVIKKIPVDEPGKYLGIAEFSKWLEGDITNLDIPLVLWFSHVKSFKRIFSEHKNSKEILDSAQGAIVEWNLYEGYDILRSLNVPLWIKIGGSKDFKEVLEDLEKMINIGYSGIVVDEEFLHRNNYPAAATALYNYLIKGDTIEKTKKVYGILCSDEE